MIINPNLLAFYHEDPDLFENMELPELSEYYFPDTVIPEEYELDKSILINNLLMECGELPVIYAEPDFLKFAITSWSRKNVGNWQKLMELAWQKYNPLSTRRDYEIYRGSISDTGTVGDLKTSTKTNTGTVTNVTDKDATHTGTDADAGSDNLSKVGSEERLKQTTDSGSDITEYTTDNTRVETRKVSAFNDFQTQTREENTITDSGTPDETTRYGKVETVSDTLSYTGRGDNRVITNTKTLNLADTEDTTDTRTDNLTESVSDSNTKTINTSKSNQYSKSNEGYNVKSLSDLIIASREAAQFNIYDYIIDDFKHRFCLEVY